MTNESTPNRPTGLRCQWTRPDGRQCQRPHGHEGEHDYGDAAIRIQPSGVPTSISRKQYIALIKSLGIDPKQLTRLEFGANAIVAEVFALNADGKRYDDPLERGQPARHVITIPVVP